MCARTESQRTEIHSEEIPGCAERHVWNFQGPATTVGALNRPEPEHDMAGQINRWSSRITQPKSQGASQAQLLATGFTEADLDKAQIGIASIWYEGNNCNMHLLDLADAVKEGVEAAGVKGMRAELPENSTICSAMIGCSESGWL